MRKFHSKTWRTLAYLAMGLAGLIGFNTITSQQDQLQDLGKENERNAIEAKQIADQLAKLIEQREEDRQATSLQSCRIRNTAQRNGRDRFVQLFENIDSLFITPEARANANRLQKGINLDAIKEDRDCNTNGVLDDGDYLSDEEEAASIIPGDTTTNTANANARTDTTTPPRPTPPNIVVPPNVQPPANPLPVPIPDIPPVPKSEDDLIDELNDLISHTCGIIPEVCVAAL